ncbi:hypothetical protein [Gordonia sp. (in: high G+C Gram-positive bacteria)]|uniref:hypothetical protein n=1 Tax=Gordonia sp. (in: high G+C Gram-positive bacteria) TaxID=84139 RepID=UPI003C744EE4
MRTAISTFRASPKLVAEAIREASGRQLLVATVVSLGVLAVMGIGTVMIPNTLFSREIAPTMWSYPVWIVTAILSGLLAATYVAPADQMPAGESPREGRWGVIGTLLTWFAIGCPVCNKIALIALGSSGAIAYFAPIQPVLAVIAIALLWFALARRLEGAKACAVPLAV